MAKNKYGPVVREDVTRMRREQERFISVLSDLGLHTTGAYFLMELDASGDRRMTHVAKRANMLPGTASKTIRILEEHNYVDLHEDQKDGRLVEVKLTGHGREILGKLYNSWNKEIQKRRY